MADTKTANINKDNTIKAELIQKERKFGSFSRTINVLLEEYFENLESEKEVDMGKNCSKCGKWKPYSEFQKDSSKATKKDPVGHSSQCKACKNKKEK
jgi:hypothetical protein